MKRNEMKMQIQTKKHYSLQLKLPSFFEDMRMKRLPPPDLPPPTVSWQFWRVGGALVVNVLCGECVVHVCVVIEWCGSEERVSEE